VASVAAAVRHPDTVRAYPERKTLPEAPSEMARVKEQMAYRL
jgi:hypothetical protein